MVYILLAQSFSLSSPPKKKKEKIYIPFDRTERPLNKPRDDVRIDEITQSAADKSSDIAHLRAVIHSSRRGSEKKFPCQNNPLRSIFHQTMRALCA